MIRMLDSVRPNRFTRLSSLRKLLLASVVFAVPVNARAMVTEPNGVTAPNAVSAQETADSGGKELHLDALFTSRMEMINFVTDGLTKPGVFSPTCSFSGEMVLRGGGCHVDFGWYNANASGVAPADNEIYVLIPGGNLPAFTPAVNDGSVHPTFNADNIRMDPNYKGGLIGFAIKKGASQCTQTHFSEQQLNGKCTNCTPVASWVTAVIWKSTKVADSYYIGFEDLPFGTTSATGLANIDGDFNDFVYFVSGVSCDGGGAPCDTGMPGVCKDGLKECVSGGMLTCKPSLKPTPEVCDGLDNDCNGMTDDMAPCPGKQICDRGVCVPPCSTTEFPCSTGYKCVRMVCVEDACADKLCPEGQICKAGVCKGKCDGVTCPLTQVCRVGRCVDPCAGIVCASDRVCSGGICVPSCKCRTCDAPKACVTAAATDPIGACVDKGCESKTCNAGEVCQGGTCTDACMGAVCPVGQECKVGACVDMPKPDGGVSTGGTGGGGAGGDTSVGGSGGGGSGGTGGGGTGGNTSAGGMGGTTSIDAGPDAPTGPPLHITPGNGCRCDASGAAPGGFAALGLALAFVVSARRRRRAR